MTDLVNTVDLWVLYTAIVVTIGTIIVAITLGRDFIRERRRVKVKVSPAHFTEEIGNTVTVRDTIDITVTNGGHRTINIHGVGFKLANGNRLSLDEIGCYDYDVPTALPAEDSHSFVVWQEEAIEALKGKAIEFAYVKDATGRFYEGRIPQSVKRILIN